MTTTTATGPALRALADRLGIIPEYRDQTGRHTRATSDETRVALLRAMGIDASTEERAQHALDALVAEERNELLAPVRVMIADGGELAVPLGAGDSSGPVEWTLELRTEGGDVQRTSGKSTPDGDAKLHASLPARPPLGYHHLRATVRTNGGERSAEQSLIVVPAACPSPDEVLHGKRVFGITANLYTVRSARNWGIGDFGDLAALLKWGGSVGAAFVGVNPLHALRNTDGDVSPYSPVSRLFRNPVYIDVESLPGYAQSSAVREIVSGAQFRAELARVRASDRVDYERVMALKRPVLRALHGAHLRGPRAQNPEWREWLESGGEALESFATFVALGEHLGRDGNGSGGGGWRDWPEEYRDPRSPAVQRFRQMHADEIDFRRWLQFVIDQQLAGAAKTAKAAGMPIGIYQDLAIGTSPNGGDLWAYPELFVDGASIGAPPDPYSATGQNWGLPPIDPRALKRQRYEYWIELVRSSLRHGGALRIDHVMGLFRQFWIPAGKSGSDGAYVRFPSEDLLGILALEAARAGALVVGEDLGTVPDDVPPAMRRWRLLSSKVLYFERGDHGSFRSPSGYDANALATANTHDMPTLEGFWRGRDIELRREVGLIESDAEAQRARAEREGEKHALLERLKGEGVLPHDVAGELWQEGASADARAAFRGAVHEFLCRTPSALVGLSLDDIVGETEPVNVPGVGSDKFPSWTRRLTMPLEELATSPAVARAVGCSRSGNPGHQR